MASEERILLATGHSPLATAQWAWASAKAESKPRPEAVKPIFSLTNLAASAAPYSRSMPRVFPLDRERAVVADGVQGPGDLLEVDLAAARRAEVPAAAGVAEVQVRAEDARLAVERPRGVLDVDVVDPVRELRG